MRKFVKTAAVLALAFALLSTSAFAALTGEVAVNQDGTYTATINGAAANEQITIIGVEVAPETVVADDPDVPALNDSNILYINQKAAAGTEDSFANFSLRGESNGRKILFFAGSATSTDAAYLGSVSETINYTVTVQSDVTVEVNQSASVALTITPDYDDTVAWSVVSDNAASATISGDAIGATFSATAAGTYKVRATLADGTTYGEADIVVNPKTIAVSVVGEPTIVKVDATVEEDVENQNAIGVALTVSGIEEEFTHMIWGFGLGDGDVSNRRYSEAIELDNAISGQYTFKAAFGNGTASGTVAGTDGKVTFAVGDVSALFTDGTETYFTHPLLDQNNGPQN